MKFLIILGGVVALFIIIFKLVKNESKNQKDSSEDGFIYHGDYSQDMWNSYLYDKYRKNKLKDWDCYD